MSYRPEGEQRSKSVSLMPLNIENRETAIINYITGHFHDGTLPELAKNQLMVSERHAGEIVKKLMGKPFKELIIEERMRVANMMIKTSGRTLEEISEYVGYSSYSGFYTAYKKYHGHAPRV